MLIWLLGIGIDVLPTAVIFGVILLCKKCTVWRQKGFLQLLLFFLLGGYLAAVFSITGLPTVIHWNFDPSFHWVPFVDIVSGPMGYLRNMVLNVILFVPMGFLLPVLWKGFRRGKDAVLAGFGVSVFIEVLQIFTFRATDMDDLIANTLGALLGWMAAKLIWKEKGKGLFGRDGGNGRAEFILIAAIVFFIYFFVQTFISDALWTAVYK